MCKNKKTDICMDLQPKGFDKNPQEKNMYILH